MALIIERAESTGEGVTEGLTLQVKGFPDSRTMGEYFARSGIKIIPSEPGEINPQWWDLFIGRADAGIAYAPEDGIAKIEIESSAALGMCLPPATIEGRRVYLGGIPDFASARDRLPADYGIEAASTNGSVDRMELLLQGRRVGVACPPPTGGPARMEFEFEDEGMAREFYRQALAVGHVAVTGDDIADMLNAYITRHHLASHEGSHARRNASLGVMGFGALVFSIVGANSVSGGALFKTVHDGAVKLGIHREPRPAFIVEDVNALVRAANVIGIGNVYLEFPERYVQGSDTVAVEVPALAKGDRVYTTGATKPDSSGGIIQITVARITDEDGNPKYEHPAGASPVASYRMSPLDQWGPIINLESLGPRYAEELQSRMEASKRIRVAGMLARVSDDAGTRYRVTSGQHSIVLGGMVDGLTAARLEQFRDQPVEVAGNVLSIMSGAYRAGRPTGQPMLQVNPQAVMPMAD